VTLSAPRVPVGSNVTGGWLTAEEATDPAYWARQLRQPVRFSAAAGLLLSQHHALLEVGPGTALATLVRQHPAAAGRTILSSLPHPSLRQPDDAAMADTLGRLWLSGGAVDWDGVWAHERRRRIALPAYPFQRRRHWVDPDGDGGAGTRVSGTGSGEETTGSPQVQPIPSEAAPQPASAQETIRRIWADMLGLADVGLHDNFFELGGHSLLGTKVIARIRDALHVELAPSALFEWPTVSQLAAAVERATAASDGGDEALELVPDLLLAEILAMSPEELQRQLADEQQAGAGSS
jgi:acyl transferase domain-containing protein